MNIAGSKARLMAVTKEIHLKWSDTQNSWKDARSREFDQRYMRELGAHVDRAVAVIEKLESMLKKVRNDCE